MFKRLTMASLLLSLAANPSHTTIADGVVYKAPKRTKH
jgi:hypothetical protein